MNRAEASGVLLDIHLGYSVILFRVFWVTCGVSL